MPLPLADAATAFVESIKISSTREEIRHGRRVILKQRSGPSDRIADLANFYFRIANLPVRFHSKSETWRSWEIKCFQMLNGPRFHAAAAGPHTVCQDKLPGRSFWLHLKQGTLTRKMLEAAGREFHRAHQFRSKAFNGAWSHGDASMPNVIYDGASHRARLIDFELAHDHSLPASFRHADDLFVFLLDMVGIISSRQWLPYALSFLKAYGDRAVIHHLKKQLHVPRGLALIWWNVRTNFASTTKVKRRLAELSRAISRLERQRSTSVRRPAERAVLPRPARLQAREYPPPNRAFG